ncbi:hypothetical protein R1sor_010616 [Riccia sorocarpa]|uniref:Uncharacterized protein n=1 Tax=Riccia sorocarpa TaxID=122646 RepID=A0ABD3HYJ6_9MARC
MSSNLMTPSLRTAKRNRAQFVPFLPGVQAQNFAEVSKILEASKRYYGIVGDVPVILAEDETRIKPHVRWESRRDTLAGSKVFEVVGGQGRCPTGAHTWYPALPGGSR